MILYHLLTTFCESSAKPAWKGLAFLRIRRQVQWEILFLWKRYACQIQCHRICHLYTWRVVTWLLSRKNWPLLTRKSPGHERRKSEVAHLCSPAFLYRTSLEIDEGLYLRRGTSYGLTSCVFHVMPRDLIVLLIINRERRYTSRLREVTGWMMLAARCCWMLTVAIAYS